MEKEKYLKIALENLLKVFSEGGAKATIDVMAKLKIGAKTDVDPNLMNDCNSVLYERVKMLKGDASAVQFLSSIKTACGGN
ncbi:MAG TPA: hypothetical protein VKL21_09345 [Candidatus Methanoperedens sp.]|nr:hypothetical protein [Candidatus Methanoperedens sp.]